MTEVDIIQGGVLKVDDTKPNLRLQLIDEDGSPANLSGQTGTIYIKKSDAESTKVSAAISLHRAESGIVEYDWQSGDTDTTGVFEADVKMEDGTDIISYPNDHFFRVHIMEDLS